ncbi:hypothetical protein PCE1_002070 [Barthelona sp. PCE]
MGFSFQAPLVVIYSLIIGLLIELVSYYFAYRSPSYKSARESLVKAINEYKQLKKRKVDILSKKKHEKSISDAESRITSLQNNMQKSKFKSAIVNMAAMFFGFRVLRKKFAGIALASLPFNPIGPIKKIAFRGIAGSGVNQAGFMFLYTLTNLSFRKHISLLFNNSIPKSPFSNFQKKLEEQQNLQ